MKATILNYIPKNYNTLTFGEKKQVLKLIKTEITKSKERLNILN